MGGRATIYFQGSEVTGDTQIGASVSNPTIADGNPTLVAINSMDLSGFNSTVSAITVTINLSGGCNNGLVAYLVAPNSTRVYLMNQPGVGADPFGIGATGAGMNITLQDGTAANGNIQNETSSGALSGTYNAAESLSWFGGAGAGVWTLYFVDTIAGGGDANLNGWSLNINPVPEPINMALAILGAVFVGTVAARGYRVSRLAKR